MHPEISDVTYHERVPGLASQSALSLVARSPAHYKAWLDGANREETPALAFGSASHCALLEPTRFARSYVVKPSFGDKRKKDNKAAHDAWCAENAGAKLLEQEDVDAIAGMSAAIKNHPLAARIMAGGEPELTLRWRDEATGLECKGRADYYVRQHKMAVDVKTTTDASPAAFAKSVANFGYHVQDAFYRDGFAALGEPLEFFIFVVVEKTAPFSVALYQLDAVAVERGQERAQRHMRTLAECVRADAYPGYATEIQTLELPRWAA